ncbi:MAG TPA: CheB methylesterase domain-containing protein, partial [Ramlibacter sp.]|nr:CheB methylesterase domain-containing protein [Ramlibacter sp.]
DWLAQASRLPVEVAHGGAPALPGHVYLAPDDHHLGVAPGGRIVLSRDPPENHVRPAVSFLFRSLATVYGAHAVGVLLTGMGRDGAEELKQMKEAGAVTIAQDQDSSLVHGMPGAAIALGGATQVLPAERIAEALAALAAAGTA